MTTGPMVEQPLLSRTIEGPSLWLEEVGYSILLSRWPSCARAWEGLAYAIITLTPSKVCRTEIRVQ